MAKPYNKIVFLHLAFGHTMETDIIFTGFKAAEKQHGVCYIKFFGDGDSSVYPTLVAGVPGLGYVITKQ